MNILIIVTTISFWGACFYFGTKVFLFVSNKTAKEIGGGPIDPFSAGILVYPGMMCTVVMEIALIYITHISGLGRLLRIIPFL